jgi:D-3-phosphoglycerate dehydrogenase
MSEGLIFVALSTFAERDRRPLAQLEASKRAFRIHGTGKRITTPELLRDGRGAAVIIAGVEPYDVATLAALPELRCVVRCGVGVDAVDLNAARARGITVLNTPEVPTAAVAELALAMFLSLSRNLRRQANRMGQRQWNRLEAHLLSRRTVGLIGLGRIGRRVAELCRAFGAHVLASDPFADASAASVLGVDLVSLEQLLRKADIVSLHAVNSANRPLKLGAAELASMKRGAILVNLARGGMVDETALADALRSGQLAGAGLDVFEHEPYAGSLCDLENVILTPHSATLTVETRAAMELECVEKALRFINGGIRAEERVA